jgi:predicted ester cyclase
MTKEDLQEKYLAYIDSLNRRDWSRLGDPPINCMNHRSRFVATL